MQQFASLCGMALFHGTRKMSSRILGSDTFTIRFYCVGENMI